MNLRKWFEDLGELAEAKKANKEAAKDAERLAVVTRYNAQFATDCRGAINGELGWFASGDVAEDPHDEPMGIRDLLGIPFSSLGTGGLQERSGALAARLEDADPTSLPPILVEFGFPAPLTARPSQFAKVQSAAQAVEARLSYLWGTWGVSDREDQQANAKSALRALETLLEACN